MASLLLISAVILMAEPSAEPNAETVRQLALQCRQPNYKVAAASIRELVALQDSPQEAASQAAKDAVANLKHDTAEWLKRVGANRWNLEADSNTVGLKFENEKDLDGLPLLYQFPNLEMVFITGKLVADKHILILLQLPRIDELDIDTTSVTGSFLREEARWLGGLRINNSPLAEAELLQARLPDLEFINLNGTPVTNATLREMKLKHIKQIGLSRTKIQREGLVEALKGYRLLKGLEIDAQFITDDLVEWILDSSDMEGVIIYYREQEKPAVDAFCKRMPAKIHVRARNENE